MDGNPFPPGKPEQTARHYRAEIDLLDCALTMLGDLTANLNGRPLDGMSREQFYTLFHCVKATKTAQAIRHLFLGGYEEDGEMLLRVLVEQAIIVRWVRQEDSDARVRAYALSLKENRFRMLEAARGFDPDVQIRQALAEEIERDGAEYKALGKNEKWRGMTREIASIAAEAGVPGSYAVHIAGSNLIHSNPVVEHHYVRTSGEYTYFNAVPCSPSDGWTPVLAAKHLLWIGEALLGVFELTEPSGLSRLHAAIDRYDPKGPTS